MVTEIEKENTLKEILNWINISYQKLKQCHWWQFKLKRFHKEDINFVGFFYDMIKNTPANELTIEMDESC